MPPMADPIRMPTMNRETCGVERCRSDLHFASAIFRRSLWKHSLTSMVGSHCFRKVEGHHPLPKCCGIHPRPERPPPPRPKLAWLLYLPHRALSSVSISGPSHWGPASFSADLPATRVHLRTSSMRRAIFFEIKPSVLISCGYPVATG